MPGGGVQDQDQDKDRPPSPDRNGDPWQQTRSNVGGDDGARIASVAATARHRMACFNCRSARQRCDRLEPCKPDTVEKLLLRISESPVGDQVVKVILDSAAAASSSSSTTSPSVPIPQSTTSDAVSRAEDHHDPIHDVTFPDGPCGTSYSHAAEPQAQSSMVSPLDILAAAVIAVSGDDNSANPSHNALRPPPETRSYGQPSTSAQPPPSPASVDQRLVRYFASPITIQKDWQVLSAQSVDNILKLESTACDPVAARLIDDTDAYLFFNLFFTIRNPLIGLLDPELHTPEYVYNTSFTLFSVICALGCAVSSRPRDRVIYAALLSLAEGNMQWSIAVSVRGLEIIQAIVLMQYWAPMRNTHSNDPYWLHLSHAAQLARELGVHDPSRVDKHLDVSVPTASPEVKERFRRNYERTWLYIFIADKGFGIVTGRRMCVAWDEIPHGVFDWWRKPMTSPYDRMISGIIETRGVLMNAFEERRGDAVTPLSVSKWHARWFDTLEHVRNVRCAPDALPSSIYLPLLAFYVDHSILVLNAQAMRDLRTPDDACSPGLWVAYQRTAKVALRALDIVMTDPVLYDLRLGFHNNQFIMICHAVAEIVQAIKKNILSPQEATDAAAKVRAIPEHLDRVVQQLPATSSAQLYASLARCLVAQVDAHVANANGQGEFAVAGFHDVSSAGGWHQGQGQGPGTGAGGVAPTSGLEQLMIDMGWGFPAGGENGDGLMFPQ